MANRRPLTVLSLLAAALVVGSNAGSSPPSCYRTSNYFRTHFNDTSTVLEQPASSKSILIRSTLLMTARSRSPYGPAA